MNRVEKTQAIQEAVWAAEGIAKRFAEKCNIRDPQFVPEVMQESYVRLLERDSTDFLASPATAKAYASGVVYNVCIWALRTYFRSAELPSVVRNSADAPAMLERDESISRVRDTLDRLSPDDRDLILTSAKYGAKRGVGTNARGKDYVRRHRAIQRFIVAFQGTVGLSVVA